MNYLTDELAAAGAAALDRARIDRSAPPRASGGAEQAEERARISVERAIDEFDRGRAVVIDDGAGSSLAMSAQAWPGRTAVLGAASAEPGAPRPEVLVLTARRALAVGMPLAGLDDGRGARRSRLDRVVRIALPASGAARLVAHATGAPSSALDVPASRALRGRLAALPVSAGTRAAAAAVALAKQARLLPCAVLEEGRAASAWPLAFEPARTRAGDVLRYASLQARALVEVARARVPLAESESCTFVLFGVGGAHAQHLAIVVGAPDYAAPVSVRLHSACLTGDVFASLRCDCGSQLRQAVDVMARGGGGVLLYLPQEGRGIGLANKLHAYGLQDTGLDTLDADAVLGFSPDERSYECAVTMLKALGVSQVRLLTNNPHKLAALGGGGIEVVERLPLVAAVNPHNRPYLEAKAQRAGHMLSVGAGGHDAL